MNATAPARFWSKVDVGAEDACWPWLGAREPSGHGRFWDGERNVVAHRFAWEQGAGRSVRAGFIVMHSCDHGWCMNPLHLTEATQADNVRDMDAKGRRRSVGHRGTTHPLAKLDAERVWRIRELRLNGLSCREIATIVAVSHGTVASVLRGATWSWLKTKENRK